MDSSHFPTKRNMLLAKQNLSLAQKGHDLLDLKRQALLIEISSFKEAAAALRPKLSQAFPAAHKALALAHMEMGRETVATISKALTSVANPPYDLSRTTAALDEAYIQWRTIKDLIARLATAENAVYRLNLQIRKTQKRAAALNNITIPMYETRIKYIRERLEERERDDLARLKAIHS